MNPICCAHIYSKHGQPHIYITLISQPINIFVSELLFLDQTRIKFVIRLVLVSKSAHNAKTSFYSFCSQTWFYALLNYRTNCCRFSLEQFLTLLLGIDPQSEPRQLHWLQKEVRLLLDL